jgi:hypothetical protein
MDGDMTVGDLAALYTSDDDRLERRGFNRDKIRALLYSGLSSADREVKFNMARANKGPGETSLGSYGEVFARQMASGSTLGVIEQFGTALRDKWAAQESKVRVDEARAKIQAIVGLSQVSREVGIPKSDLEGPVAVVVKDAVADGSPQESVVAGTKKAMNGYAGNERAVDQAVEAVEAKFAERPGADSPGANPNLGQRHNNPLNLKVGKWSQQFIDEGVAERGEAGTDGGFFLAFVNPQEGMNAAAMVLEKNYGGLKLDEALKKWSGGGYDSTAFDSGFGGGIGATGDTKVADLSEEQFGRMMYLMSRKEGFYAGGLNPFNNKDAGQKNIVARTDTVAANIAYEDIMTYELTPTESRLGKLSDEGFAAVSQKFGVDPTDRKKAMGLIMSSFDPDPEQTERVGDKKRRRRNEEINQLKQNYLTK